MATDLSVTALSEALATAQRRAIGALEKAYVRGSLERDELRAMLDSFGCTDKVDQECLLDALDAIRTFGGEAPTNGAPAKTDERASEKQRGFIRQLCDEHGVEPPNWTPSKVQASEIITQLQNGTYDPAAWQVSF